ncbi:MAG: hypothetical protein WCL51_02290 [Bacteroidota bacterium]
MKKHILILVFILLTSNLFCKQIQFNSTNDVINYIAGKWNIYCVCDTGMTGQYHSVNYNQYYIFNKIMGFQDRVKYTYYRDSCGSNFGIAFIKDSVTLEHGDMWILYPIYGGNTSEQFVEDFFISSPLLIIADVCNKCPSTMYKKDTSYTPSIVSTPTLSSTKTILLTLLLLSIGSIYIYRNSNRVKRFNLSNKQFLL